jgi:hypothetical protein
MDFSVKLQIAQFVTQIIIGAGLLLQGCMLIKLALKKDK